MLQYIRVLAVLAVLALCSWAVSYAKRTPDPVPASAPATEFSSERAMAHVRRIAAHPHPSGSAEHAEVVAYLTGEIQKLGLTASVQEITAVGTRYPVAGHVKNILTRIPGRTPGGAAVLLVAHYDGVPAGPAAGDDAAGSAALLEVVRAIKAGPQLAHDVILLITDSEELGLLGAAGFVREHAWARDVAVILNFEARGVNGPSLMFETGRGNLDVARVLRGSARWTARGTSLSTMVYRLLSNDTDLSELALLDKPAMNFAFVGGVERYHTSQDDTTHLSRGSLQHHGVQALALARAFADDSLPRPVTRDAVFFFYPGFGMVVYSEWAAIAWGIAALLLAVVAVVRRQKANPDGWSGAVIIGAMTSLVAPLLGGVVGYGLGAGITGFHRASGSGDPRWSSAYATGVALAVMAIVMLVHRLAMRNRPAGAEVGAVLAWSVLAVVAGALAPAASFLLTWPVLFAAIASLFSPGEDKSIHWAHWIAPLVIIPMIAPTAYLAVVATLGLDATGGAVIGILTAVAVTLARPLLVTPGDRWLPKVALLAGAVWAMIVGLANVHTNSEHPASATLALLIDADSGRAFATGYGNLGAANDFVARTIGDQKIRPDSLPVWVRRIAGNRVATKAQPFVSPMATPRVTVLRDSMIGAERDVLVRILPANKNVLGIRLDVDGAQVTSSSVDGRAVKTDRYRRALNRWTLEFTAPPDTGFTLGLRLAGAASPTLGVAARVAGLVAWPISMRFRPPEVMAIQSGDVSIVYTRASLTRPTRRR